MSLKDDIKNVIGKHLIVKLLGNINTNDDDIKQLIQNEHITRLENDIRLLNNGSLLVGKKENNVADSKDIRNECKTPIIDNKVNGIEMIKKASKGYFNPSQIVKLEFGRNRISTVYCTMKDGSITTVESEHVSDYKPSSYPKLGAIFKHAGVNFTAINSTRIRLENNKYDSMIITNSMSITMDELKEFANPDYKKNKNDLKIVKIVTGSFNSGNIWEIYFDDDTMICVDIFNEDKTFFHKYGMENIYLDVYNSEGDIRITNNDWAININSNRVIIGYALYKMNNGNFSNVSKDIHPAR